MHSVKKSIRYYIKRKSKQSLNLEPALKKQDKRKEKNMSGLTLSF